MSTTPHVFRTIWRRELKFYLRGMSGWLLVAGFSAITDAVLLVRIAEESGKMQTIPNLFAAALLWALPALVALVTMRTFAEERATGTLELLLTAPVPDRSVVLAKFAAAYTVVFLAVLASIGGLAIYAETASPHPDYSRTGVAAATGVLLLHAASWTAAGLLASLFVRRQAAAAILTLAVTLPAALVLSGELAPYTSFKSLEYLAIGEVARGVVDSRTIVLAVSTLLLYLFTAVRALEARRWKL